MTKEEALSQLKNAVKACREAGIKIGFQPVDWNQQTQIVIDKVTYVDCTLVDISKNGNYPLA